MSYNLNRRTVLRGIGAGAITLNFAGRVTAASESRYIISGQGNGLRKRLERNGFTIQRSLADGQVWLVVGDADREGDLDEVKGVKHAMHDLQFRMEKPQKHAAYEGRDQFPVPDIDDDLFELQWDKDVTSVPDAHDTATGEGRSIAIIDTGVGVNHPNLAGNLDIDRGRRFRALEVGSDLEVGKLASEPVQGGTAEVEVPVQRDDPSTDEIETDLTKGTTILTDEVVNDVDGHGSNVSGIAAANPGKGLPITGTAPDATIIPLRVFWWIEADVDADDDGEVEEDAAALFTTTGDILTAIDYAAHIGVDAMNMSIGTPPIPPSANRDRFRPIYQTVIESAVRRGSVVVVSAGNASANLQSGFFTVPNSVAGAMSISATGPNDELTFYSNYGTNEIDVGAPGGGYETLVKTLCTDEGVVSGSCEENEDGETDCVECQPGAWPFPFNLVFNAFMVDADGDGLLEAPEYAFFAGTSMAAPQVTGTAALIREVAPNTNAKQVEQAIEQGADLVPGKNDPELGAGRLNADSALEAASNDESGS